MSRFWQTRQECPPGCRVGDVLRLCRIGLHWQVLGALSSKCQVVPVPVLELCKLTAFRGRWSQVPWRWPAQASSVGQRQISNSVKKGGCLHCVWGVKRFLQRHIWSRNQFRGSEQLSGGLTYPCPHYTGSYIPYTLQHQYLKLKWCWELIMKP